MPNIPELSPDSHLKISSQHFRERQRQERSSVEELYYICTHRNLHGVTHEFLDCYIERISPLI
ncbi:MAG: hypothetical protein IKQ95_08420 [Synergistaceae bacterium]|nr:hypothetical protein [Synergistaceae bacterium]